MRITFVLPTVSLAGGNRVIAIYAERLRRRGHDVALVSIPPRQIPLRRKIKSIVLGRGWPATRAQEPSHFDSLDVPHRVIERYRPVVDHDLPNADVVVATFWQTAAWVAGLSPGKGAKAFFIQGYEVLPGSENSDLDAAWRLPMHKILISRWLVELARNQFNDDDVSHVPNSVDTDQFFAHERTKHPTPTVGLLYASHPIKGADIAIKAIQRARTVIPEVGVVSFGVEHPSPRLPLPANTHFTYRPAQDAIRDLYARCDVWLCGSRREGFHLPPLEAMACRCPVVSTRVGGPVDTIQDGHNGFLVDIEDHQALSERLIDVMRLPTSEWRKLSDAALQTATRYTWDDATTRFEAALMRAMERRAGARASARQRVSV